VNRRLLGQLVPEQVQVEVLRVQQTEDYTVEESELDEMWSYVKSKDNPRWLWHAIDRGTGQVLAYVFGARKDSVFLQRESITRTVWNQKILYRWLGSLPSVFGVGKA